MQERLTNIYYQSYYKENNNTLLLKILFDSFFYVQNLFKTLTK